MQKSDAYRRFEENLFIRLDGAAGGEPVDITPICDLSASARFEASIWTRPDIVRTTVPGPAPVGPIVADEAEARAALAAAAAEAVVHPAVTGRVKAMLSAGGGLDFVDMQGAWREAPLPQTRSVVRKCAACAGAGSFACDACGGEGDRLCERCDGAGVVDHVCGVCRGRARGAESSGRAVWEESVLSFRRRQADKDADPECEACGGAGAVRSTCEACGGAKRVPCAHCDGVGRITCADCEGTGTQTDRYNPTLVFHYAVFTGVTPELPPSQLAKFRRGVQILAKHGLITPRFFDFQSDALGHRAVFVAETPFVGARVAVGRRSPRVMAEIYAAGEGTTLIDPPPLIDALHQRALDGLRMSEADGPRRLADALTERELGRAALRAAARRDFAFDASEFEPLATQTYGRRIFELAKACHRYVGWRARRWFWPAAAAAAPLLAALLDALGATSAIAGWTSLAAASSGFDAEAARTTAVDGGVFAARVASLALWFVLAAAGAAALYRISVRRALRLNRRASRWDVFRAGPAPFFGFVGAALLTAVFVSPPPPDPELVARAGALAERSEAAREEAQTLATAAAARAPTEWRLARSADGLLFARAAARPPASATLSLRCRGGAAIMRFEEDAPYLLRGAPISIGLSTNRRALGVEPARVVADGVVEWIADRNELQALRSGVWVRVELLDGAMRWPTREFDLAGSADAIAQATAACPG